MTPFYHKSRPLSRHRICDALVGNRADHRSVGGRWQLVLAAVRLVGPSFAAIDNPPWNTATREEGRESMQPKASSFTRIISEHVWLNDLIRLAIEPTHAADGVLNGPATAQRGKDAEEPHGFLRLRGPFGAASIPVQARNAEVRTGREGYYSIPVGAQDFQCVVLDMERRAIVGRLQVARVCLMPLGPEGATDDSRAFTREQQLHV
jgi:hypothetical protein